MMLNLAILVSLLPLAASEAVCNHGKYEPAFDACISLFSQSDFNGGQEYCEQIGGNMVTIENAFQNAILGSDEHRAFNYSNKFIGFVHFNGSWEWIDGSTVTYINWAGGEPSGGACTVIDPINQRWYAADCSSRMPWSCKTAAVQSNSTSPAPDYTTRLPYNVTSDATNTAPQFTTVPSIHTTVPVPTRPQGWVYFAETDSYYLFGENKTHDEAADYCGDFDSYLASVHSLNESNFISQMNFAQCSGALAKGLEGHTLLGGEYSSYDGSITWEDGTTYDFHNKYCSKHGGSRLAIVSTPFSCTGCTPGYWAVPDGMRYNDAVFPFFVCKKSATPNEEKKGFLKKRRSTAQKRV